MNPFIGDNLSVFDTEVGEKIYQEFHEVNKRLAEQAPSKFARILGVPVIHTSHSGGFEGYSNGKNKTCCTREILGNTEIIDGTGKVLASLQEKAKYKDK